jgi:hypothetical protein
MGFLDWERLESLVYRVCDLLVDRSQPSGTEQSGHPRHAAELGSDKGAVTNRLLAYDNAFLSAESCFNSGTNRKMQGRQQHIRYLQQSVQEAWNPPRP